MTMERRIKLKTLNSHITCKICRGYLIDATTVTECLHTFCKSCLVKHLEENNTCPTCQIVIHQSHPLQYISFDRTMQDIVYKLVPNLQDNEIKREREFYRMRGLPCPKDIPPIAGELEEEKVPPDQHAESDYHRQDEQVNVCLECMSTNMKTLKRRFIRCSAQATITHLKKFIAKKVLNGTEKYRDIDILCNDELLGKDHTLKFVYVTRWRFRDPPLRVIQLTMNQLTMFFHWTCGHVFSAAVTIIKVNLVSGSPVSSQQWFSVVQLFVLIFPPVNNFRRFLIHKVSEDYSDELCTFSIGQGHGRRTVVCFKEHLLRDLNQVKSIDECRVGAAQPIERSKVMGIERQQLTTQVTSTVTHENSVKRAKAMPTVGIYRPPALRRLEGQITTTVSGNSLPANEVKHERTRPPRQRRPDIQVYVPRAKRLIGEQEKPSFASQQSNRTKGWNPVTDKNYKSKTDHEEISKIADIPSNRFLQDECTQISEVGVGRGMRRRGSVNSSCDNLPAESANNIFNQQKLTMEISNCENDTKSSQFDEKLCSYPSSCCKERDLKSASDVTMLDAWNHSRSVELTKNFLEDASVGQCFTSRDSKSPSTASSGRDTPSSPTDNGGQTWDYFSEVKNATNSLYNRSRNCESDPQNMPNILKTEDSKFLSEPINETLKHKNSDLISDIKDCDISDKLLGCSSLTEESKIECDDKGDNNAPSDSPESENSKLDTEAKVNSQDMHNNECYGQKKDEDKCKVQEAKNRKNRRIIRGNFVSDVLIISDQEPGTSSLTENDTSMEKASPSNGVLTKKKKVRHKTESNSPPKIQPPEKQKPSSNPVTVTLNPDECTWDMMFDDNGECLDPRLMEELTSAVGSVAIEKPQSDYRNYQSRLQLMTSGLADDEFSHVLEIYNFPPEFKTQDLFTVFSPYMRGGFEIKWVDDTHALGVFSSSAIAAEVLAADHPFIKTRPLQEATHESRMKARRSAEFLQPYRPRPETCAALARRLVTGALGVKLSTSREEREAERKILKEARERKRVAARQRDEAWEGTIGEK